MARVDIVREVRPDDVGGWQLCFQWCRYRMDDGDVLYGYRFVWRRAEDGSIQAARGQARIPNLAIATELMEKAKAAGWGERDGYAIQEAASRIQSEGCVVDLATGYVGWPSQEAAQRGILSDQGNKDAQLIRSWCMQ